MPRASYLAKLRARGAEVYERYLQSRRGEYNIPATRVRNLLTAARRRAERAGLPFALVASDIVIPQVCPVLGLPISLDDGDINTSPSLDRVRPELGYVPGNVVVMSFRANTLKNNASVTELLKTALYLQGA